MRRRLGPIGKQGEAALRARRYAGYLISPERKQAEKLSTAGGGIPAEQYLI